MILDIKPIRNAKYNCFEGVVASVARYFNLEYALMFFAVWGFKFDSKETGNEISMGERLNRGDRDNQILLLKKYHDLYIEGFNFSDEIDVLDIVRRELSDENPVAIVTNARYCRWNLGYLYYDYTHVYLIIGIDEVMQELLCIDPYCSDNIERLHFYEFNNVVEGYFTFNKETKYRKEFIWEKCLFDSLNIIREDNGTFKAMRRFACEIENSDNLINEYGVNNDLYGSLLIRRLTEIGADRHKFKELLTYLSERRNVNSLNKYIADMSRISETWDNIILMLIKEMYKSQVNSTKARTKKIANMILMVVEYEEKLAQELLKLCSMQTKTVY